MKLEVKGRSDASHISWNGERVSIPGTTLTPSVAADIHAHLNQVQKRATEEGVRVGEGEFLC